MHPQALILTTLLLPVLAHASAEHPSTAAELHAHLARANANNKAEVLEALPEELKHNFVLVANSRSLQKGTPALPRVLHFSKSADLIVTSSGHSKKDDFGGDHLEAMELDRATGSWIMASIPFEKGKLSPPVYGERSCLACHGVNPRPIWGAYGNWPDTYGGRVENGQEVMGEEERSLFRSFLEKAKEADGYKHLELALGNHSFVLPATTFPLPNSTFTARLGQRTADALFLQIKRLPDYKKLRLALLGSAPALCSESNMLSSQLARAYQERLATDPAFAAAWGGEPALLPLTQVLRLLGINNKTAFRLERLPRFFDPAQTEESLLEWSAGSDGLLDLLLFLVLEDSRKEDAQLGRLLVPLEGKINRAYELSFQADSAGLLSLDKTGSADDYRASLWPNLESGIFSEIRGEAGTASEACEYFTHSAIY